MPVGEVAILNVGAGDTKLVFDNSDPNEADKSAKIVVDMIRRGFVLLIEVGRNDKGPIYQRARGFDPETREYIVAGGPMEEEQHEEAAPQAAPRPRGRPKGSTAKRAPKSRRIPASTTNAVSVSRTAGG